MEWNSNVSSKLVWSTDIINRSEKEKVARRIAERAKDGEVIGAGSGSTSFLALQFIAERLHKTGIQIRTIPTSNEITIACSVLGIPTTSLLDSRPDWCFDGADEVDPKHNVIKGRGGAMFKEKILLASSPETYILVDSTKLVTRLGEKFPIPIEVYPLAVHFVEENVLKLGAKEVTLRLARNKDGPVITENGNFILDTFFSNVEASLEKQLKEIPGVIESGLFWGYNLTVMVAGDE